MSESLKFKVRINAKGREEIFDPVRRKYVVLTPEERVRQQTLHYLIHEKHFPVSLIAVERALSVNGLTKRTDIVAYSSEGKPLLLVECKAPDVRIDQATFDQAFRYNINLRVPFLVITNGKQFYFCEITGHHIGFREEMPSYTEMLKEAGQEKAR